MAMFGFANLVQSSTITTSAAVPGLDASQLQSEHGSASTAFQSTGTSAMIALDSGSASTVWRASGLFRTNLSASARWRIILWAGAAGSGSAAVYTMGNTNPKALTGVLSGTALHVMPADMVGQTLQIDIDDPSNPDGFINVPLLYAGPVWQPKINFGPESALGRDSQADETTTRGGTEFVAHRWTRLRHDVSLNGLATDEIWPSVMAMDAIARRGANILYVPDPTSVDAPKEAVFGRLKATADITYPAHPNPVRAWRATITERL
ncbi:hypothetical protein [Granulibacter bethesdensis]|uniref:hypothetical protein n=1 Tax=Granulibacter bethesdensis TaxID=364410 RepID=UPI0003F1FFBB|nr:hypothetical protein [Granulibacter bethesdensis]AHJ69328.1 Hypothetical protein GbCGDNIH2_7279 [Granulibacter bethesdensis]